ncbi:MAG: hypothetical protein LIP77_07130 [Planctomycetes bacterium]|nr:hypothetical protein [Planctomycetota bacterium]
MSNIKQRRQTTKAREKCRPRHYNLMEAARMLGVSRHYFYAQSHPIYRPLAVRKRINIYTEKHIEVLSLVMRGMVTEDDGYALIQQFAMDELASVIGTGQPSPDR